MNQYFLWQLALHLCPSLRILIQRNVFNLQVVGCLIALIEQNNYTSKDNGSIFLACDTVLNLLLKVVPAQQHLIWWISYVCMMLLTMLPSQREQIKFPSDDPSFIRLLVALSHWAGNIFNSTFLHLPSPISWCPLHSLFMPPVCSISKKLKTNAHPLFAKRCNF